MARIIAGELGADFIETSAPALEKVKDLFGILTGFHRYTVLFIDEIHRLRREVEESLYKPMEDHLFDWPVGDGDARHIVTIPLQPFTLIGATTRAGMLTKPLRDRFGILERFDFYGPEDMEKIVTRSAGILGVEMEGGAALMLAKAARGTPRVANRLLRRIRDYGEVRAHRQGGRALLTPDVVREGLERLETDEMGLEKTDRAILRVIIERYGGGPVGAETLAVSIGESVDTLEDYYEPYLVQAGLIQRTPRGRMATALAYRHLNIEQKGVSAGATLFDV
jgi:Holliday junction DNA helicase RuvB